MKTSDFDFTLPEELIAQQPAPTRDASRMLVVHRSSGLLEHKHFYDVPDYLRPKDLLVVNNTKVIPARLFGKKPNTGGKVEFLFIEELEPNVWEVLMRSKRRPDVGSTVLLGDGAARAIVLQDGELGRALIRVESAAPFNTLLQQFGITPLPPYIARKNLDSAQKKEDEHRYQTIFAKEAGAIAAPTAGLHFTPAILEALAKKGVGRTEVTLHVGPGTFRPVATEDVEAHAMDPERFCISEGAAHQIISTKQNGGRVVAVGSTSVRTLEAVAQTHGQIAACNGRASIFIYPPFNFRVVDVLLTNFHLPRSTLIMMICALAGRDLIMKAYAEAIRERYRFYSYGDCMLIV